MSASERARGESIVPRFSWFGVNGSGGTGRLYAGRGARGKPGLNSHPARLDSREDECALNAESVGSAAHSHSA